MIRQEKLLRVLVAETSSHARLVLENILTGEQRLQVVGLATDGEHLLQELHLQKPDVVVASADLRDNNELLAFKRIFSEVPTPILMVVSKEHLTLGLLKQAIDLGVYGVVLKPAPARRPNYRSIAADIVQKVYAVRSSEYWSTEKRLHMLGKEVNLMPVSARRPVKNQTAKTIIVIGASTGGTQAVEQIVRQLDPGLNASVLVAIHLPPKFTHSYTGRLKAITPLSVIEGKTGIIPRAGKIIVAPGGRNMVVESIMGDSGNLKIAFRDDDSPMLDSPSVDKLMHSVAASGVRSVIGVLLTGMGKDGTSGAGAIRLHNGGHVIAQDEESSAIFGMAKSAIESGYTNKVLPLAQIAFYLNKYVAAQEQLVSTTDMDT